MKHCCFHRNSSQTEILFHGSTTSLMFQTETFTLSSVDYWVLYKLERNKVVAQFYYSDTQCMCSCKFGLCQISAFLLLSHQMI